MTASASSARASRRPTAPSSTGWCGRGPAARSRRSRARSRRPPSPERGTAVNLSHFFIDRPIFATVLSVFIILIGAAAYFTLPVAQYPEIAPPTIVVSATYPGASAEVVSDTVATPLAQQQLPEEVQRLGVIVKKNSPDMLMVIHLSSPDASRDQLYISNYATLQVKDELARLDGVGDVRVFGARDYAMRIWLDPDKIAARNLTAGEIVSALQSQNVQVASGVLNQ